MSARLFYNGTLQQLRHVHQHLSMSGVFKAKVLNLQCPIGQAATQIYSVQRLHVKVYDHEANLEAQRQANKLRNLPENELSEAQPKLLAKEKNHKQLEKQHLPTISETTPAAAVDSADIFGNPKNVEVDEGDRIEEEYISKPPRRARKLRTKEYARLIKENFNAHRVKDAIDVLEIRMLKEDRVKPENYIYNLLISGCARAGYTRKAFSLFTKMRQRGLKVTGGTYTSLFNACANAPSAIDGLTHANRLRQIMLEKEVEPNAKTYNAMIKAYGRCNDPKTAYLLADEMREKQLDVSTETCNFLLQACASDKEFGFRHCLLTWHKMIQRGLQPDYYTFNTVLRCVRDCGFGDLQTMQQVLEQILKTRPPMFTDTQEETNANLLLDDSLKPKLTEDVTPREDMVTVSAVALQEGASQTLTIPNDSQKLEIPNLLAPRPHLGSLVSLSEVTYAHERFLLLGGLNGFLDIMKQNSVTPDIETFTTMLEVIPPTNAAEKQLLAFVRKIGLKADIDFFNILIKKRSMRFDYDGAKEVVSMIRTAGLHPNIMTYGVLALGCESEEHARELLHEMRDKGVRMNTQILGAMLRQGCAKKNFCYISEIIQISLDEQVKPNDVFLRHLHNFYNQCAKAIDARHPSTKTKAFKKDHGKFCDKLRLYYEELGIANLKLGDAIKKVKARPYDQFKEEPVTGLENVKNEKFAKKQKIRKYIKKIKIANLRDDPPVSEKIQSRIE